MPRSDAVPRARFARRRSVTVAGAAVLAAVLALAGCNYVSVRSQAYLGVPVSPPTDPKTVEILPGEPTRPHDRLGEVVATPTGDPSRAQYEDALRSEAAKLGANAVVVVSDRYQVVGYWVDPWWPTPTPVVGRVVVGVAIRYR